MKHIAAAIAALMTIGLSGEASAGQPDAGESVLLRDLIGNVSAIGSEQLGQKPPPLRPVPVAMATAPVLDASQPPVVVDPPIVAGSIHQRSSHQRSSGTKQDAIQKPPLPRQHAKSQPNMLDKLKEMDRKKNAWFKRTFLRK